eukprot:scaffold104137_cov87-Phaeocystis_antarctica.AAC.2
MKLQHLKRYCAAWPMLPRAHRQCVTFLWPRGLKHTRAPVGSGSAPPGAASSAAGAQPGVSW